MGNRRCPLCNGRVVYPQGLGFLVCSECKELLYVNEVVHKSTPGTRMAYLRANSQWHRGRPQPIKKGV